MRKSVNRRQLLKEKKAALNRNGSRHRHTELCHTEAYLISIYFLVGYCSEELLGCDELVSQLDITMMLTAYPSELRTAASSIKLVYIQTLAY